MNLVLDNSVSMRWIQASNKKQDQDYANIILDLFFSKNMIALTPCIWRIEATHAVLNAVKHKNITKSDAASYFDLLSDLDIQLDNGTTKTAFISTYQLAKKNNLSAYDASYIELAIRKELPLASLDKSVIKAAQKESVELWLP